MVEATMKGPQLRRGRERGQGLTEYVVLVCLCMLVLLGVMGIFLGYVGDFYSNLIKVICLPLP